MELLSLHLKFLLCDQCWGLSPPSSALELTRELLSRRAVVRLLLRLKARTWPSLVRRLTSLSEKDKRGTGRLGWRRLPGPTERL